MGGNQRIKRINYPSSLENSGKGAKGDLAERGQGACGARRRKRALRGFAGRGPPRSAARAQCRWRSWACRFPRSGLEAVGTPGALLRSRAKSARCCGTTARPQRWQLASRCTSALHLRAAPQRPHLMTLAPAAPAAPQQRAAPPDRDDASSTTRGSTGPRLGSRYG